MEIGIADPEALAQIPEEEPPAIAPPVVAQPAADHPELMNPVVNQRFNVLEAEIEALHMALRNLPSRVLAYQRDYLQDAARAATAANLAAANNDAAEAAIANAPREVYVPEETQPPIAQQPEVARPAVTTPAVAQTETTQPPVAMQIAARPVIAQPSAARPVTAPPTAAPPSDAPPVVSSAPITATACSSEVSCPLIAERTPMRQQHPEDADLLKAKSYCSSIPDLPRRIPDAWMRWPNVKFDVINWSSPTNSKEVQSVLGFLNYFQDFVPEFAKPDLPSFQAKQQADPLLCTVLTFIILMATLLVECGRGFGRNEYMDGVIYWKTSLVCIGSKQRFMSVQPNSLLNLWIDGFRLTANLHLKDQWFSGLYLVGYVLKDYCSHCSKIRIDHDLIDYSVKFRILLVRIIWMVLVTGRDCPHMVTIIWILVVK